MTTEEERLKKWWSLAMTAAVAGFVSGVILILMAWVLIQMIEALPW